MKKLLFALLLFVGVSLFTNPVKAQYLSFESVKVDDGWYKATVKYQNISTYTKATYTLKVKIEYGRVTAIDFGNGGSVHTGINNEGYIYTGGTLSNDKDYQGNITGASSRITVTDNNGTRYFDVSI